MHRALVLAQQPTFTAQVQELDDSALPDGDVTVDVEWSTVNYKDALAITNTMPIVRSWPMVAGIDGAGTVVASSTAQWAPGDNVILNGFGVGESHPGCLAGRARLHGEWLVGRPESLSARQAMAIGTAGYTAMLCVLALEDAGVRADHGNVLVTGSTGGVGSVAIALLSRLGFAVTAATGRMSESAYLRSLGAHEVIDRAALSSPGRPLQGEKWAAVIDAVGSHTLANACAQMRYGGVVAACGMAQGADLPGSVLPFILRGVRLVGIDSVYAPFARRQEAWDRLSHDLDAGLLETMTSEIDLVDVPQAARRLLAGQVRGRLVVAV